jgi:flagellar motor switch protein FliN
MRAFHALLRIHMADSTSENLDTLEAAVAAAAMPEEAQAAPEGVQAATGIEAELEQLPVYARGLLHIRVPVQVTLASQRKSIKEIIELGPGSIIKFDKTCDEPLDLMVGDRAVAQGEVVKVGDKFGLKISGIVK